MRGYVQVYTGDGKGKTTAALGLAIRAAGAGMQVFFAQFVKGQDYSEIRLLRNKIPEIEFQQYGRECFIKKEPEKEDIQIARKGLNAVKNKIISNQYDLIVLDELNIAFYYDLISIEEGLELVKQKPNKLELVITGRKAPNKIIEAADLVTEMKEIKHYFRKNVKARKGIEY
ncbi:MAG: cob(I)yrinic acid a,c-diamide adenosyltransferase [Candidatus Marinimicrobia bacterium]|nr:cob(I)yrinic acid a,c-diamide adenosyltransferase [Candidatus Neomarinimicrobiota bacterium]